MTQHYIYAYFESFVASNVYTNTYSVNFRHHSSLHLCVFSKFRSVKCVYIFLSFLITGWRRLIGSPKLQVIFHKRATKYRSLLRKMTYKDKGSYESLPPCTARTIACQSPVKTNYAVALLSRIDKMIGLFCKRVL